MEAFKYFSIGFDKLKEAVYSSGSPNSTESLELKPKTEKRMIKSDTNRSTEAVKPDEVEIKEKEE